MRIRLWRIPAALLLLVAAGAGQVPDVVKQVNQSNYTHYLNDVLYTHNGDDRGPVAPQHDLARANIRDLFSSFGLTTSLHPFQVGDATFYNVVAVLEGKARPFEYHVLGAHYDSLSTPGADDDATGVAAVLEAARVLSMHDFEASVVFIAFDREEAGLLGSKAWAAEHATDQILSVVTLDMIGFNPLGANHNMVALCPPTAADNPTLIAFETAVNEHSGGLIPVYGGVSTRSDHASFATIAPSVEIIEASFYSNGNYHSAADSVDTPHYLDYWFGTGVTRSTVGYLASQAGLLPEDESALRLSTAGIANGASWVVGAVAASELVTLTGAGFSGAIRIAIRDSQGEEQPVTVNHASLRQVNVVLPERLAPGPATITATRADGAQVSASAPIEAVAPGLFSADSSGSGAASAQAVRISGSGAQTWQALFSCTDSAACTAVPVDFGTEDERVILILYGTGIRGRSALDSVTLDIDGQPFPVQYAGAQPAYAGLDQVNIELPRVLCNRGAVSATLRVDGRLSNPVSLQL